MADFTNTFADFENELRDIYDEAHGRDERKETPSCGGCDYYIACDVEGYEGVGWCTLFGAFYTTDNPFDDCWEAG